MRYQGYGFRSCLLASNVGQGASEAFAGDDGFETTSKITRVRSFLGNSAPASYRHVPDMEAWIARIGFQKCSDFAASLLPRIRGPCKASF